MERRAWRHVLAGLLPVVLAFACGAPAPSDPPQLDANQLMAQINVEVQARDVRMVATGAFADFGLDEGVHLVHVRMVDAMTVAVRIQSARDVAFAEPPRICLYGPYPAPGDGGVWVPCWGEPDLTELLAARLPKLAGDQVGLRAGEPIELTANLVRGSERCDFPPGEWRLDLDARPLVADAPRDSSNFAPPAIFEVAIPADETPLPYVLSVENRYCGLATVIHEQQGEPPIQPRS